MIDDNGDDNNIEVQIQRKANELSTNQIFLEEGILGANGNEVGQYSFTSASHDTSSQTSNKPSFERSTSEVLLFNNEQRIDQNHREHELKRKLCAIDRGWNDDTHTPSSSFYDHAMNESNFDSSSTFDIELLLSKKEKRQNKQEKKQVERYDNFDQDYEEEIQIKPIRNQVQIHCYIPPKSNDLSLYSSRHESKTRTAKNVLSNLFHQQRLYGSFMGKTGFIHQRGYADTQLLIGYYLWNGKSFLYDWNTENGTSKVCLDCALFPFT